MSPASARIAATRRSAGGIAGLGPEARIVLLADVLGVIGIAERVLRDDSDVAPVEAGIAFPALGLLAFDERHVGRHEAAEIGPAVIDGVRVHRRHDVVAELVAEPMVGLVAVVEVAPERQQRQAHRRHAEADRPEALGESGTISCR